MQDVELIQQKLRAVLSGRPEVLEAYLFGSVARGEAGPLSDIDVAVYVDQAKLPDAPYGYDALLTTDLMAALGTNDVDVVILNHAPPLLYHRVLRDGIRLCSQDLRSTTTREGQALSRYFDWLPHQRKMSEILDRRIDTGNFGR